MVIFNALLNLSELKELYSGKPVCVCPLYNGVLNTPKTFEATGNPIVLPEYKSLVKLKTTFSPKQAGSGDPSPENVRPISGWDSVKVTVSNENESHDYDIAFPETIGGGTVDAVTGVGEKTWGLVEFDGTESWTKYSGQTVGNTSVFCIILGNKQLGENVSICSSFVNRYYAWANGVPWAYSDHVSSDLTYFSVPDTMDTVESWKSYLAAQAAAGTPVQVAYKLATPEPFEISQVSIPSLKSKNTFFTNGENMDIIYNWSSFWG